MRSLLAATAMIAVIAGSALAKPGPKPAAATSARPALQTPADTAGTMLQSERLAIQSDLVWTGEYNGLVDGQASDRMVTAIKAFQKDRGGKPTGVLNPQERSTLAEAARKAQGNVGWKIVTDAGSGARLGIPAKLAPKQSADANGASWSSTTGTIQIELTRRKATDASLTKLADAERGKPGRTIEYSAVKPDFFVISGSQGLKKFYLRGQTRGDEVRILTVLYDQAIDGTMARVVVAMSSAFNPFPSLGAGSQPRKTVEYGSGIVVSGDGAILTDRALTDGCLSLLIAGHGNAERTADDKERGLALLRLYGARGLMPLPLGNGAAKPAVLLTGIADPQNQGGGAAVTSVAATATQTGGTGDLALVPAPGRGFSGAAAIDGDGGFAGMALLKPAILASGSAAASPPQVVLVPADIVRAFLRDHGVTPASGATADATAAMVRVICVRK